MIRRMNPPRKSGVSADIVAADLTLAVGQLIRRLRSEIESGEPACPRRARSRDSNGTGR